MGMLMHHTWLAQQKEKEQPKKKAEPAPATEEPKEPVKEPVKRTGGRRKTGK